MHVSVPASSANLGPGFDTLGLALDLPFELIGGRSASGDESSGFLVAEPGHPARVAFVEAGGDPDEQLWWRSPIPPGRGIGFSGAARVAGAYLALALALASDGPAAATSEAASLQLAAFRVAARLEGHPDNAAASAFGGMTVAVGADAVRVEVPDGLYESLRVVTWSPAEGTSTNSSRSHLGETVPLAAAVDSIGRSSLWVAAMSTGRLGVLREACMDQLHQPSRLKARPDTAAILDLCLRDDDVLAAWLSGSGPTVAALVGSDEAARGVERRLRSHTHPVHSAGNAQDGPERDTSAVESTNGGRRNSARVRILAIASTGVRMVQAGVDEVRS